VPAPTCREARCKRGSERRCRSVVARVSGRGTPAGEAHSHLGVVREPHGAAHRRPVLLQPGDGLLEGGRGWVALHLRGPRRGGGRGFGGAAGRNGAHPRGQWPERRPPADEVQGLAQARNASQVYGGASPSRSGAQGSQQGQPTSANPAQALQAAHFLVHLRFKHTCHLCNSKEYGGFQCGLVGWRKFWGCVVGAGLPPLALAAPGARHNCATSPKIGST
jgi:hypothetical protein